MTGSIAELGSIFNQKFPLEAFRQRNGAFWGTFRDGPNDAIVENLKTQTKTTQNSVLIGIGGAANLSLAAALKIQNIIFAAPDFDQFTLMNQVLELIKMQETPEAFKVALFDFMQKECIGSDPLSRDGRIILNIKDYELHALDPNRFPLGVTYEERPGEELPVPLDMKARFDNSYCHQTHRFTGSPENYSFIRDAVIKGRVGICRLNVMNAEQMIFLARQLSDANLQLDVARISNILCHYYYTGKKTGYLGDKLSDDPASTLQTNLRFFGDAVKVVDSGLKKPDAKTPNPITINLTQLHLLANSYGIHNRGGRWA